MKNVFYNADYVVVEYMDLIKSPYLVLLNVMRKNPALANILNIDEIRYLTDKGLYEWYINRKHQNFLRDLVNVDGVTDADLDSLLNDQIGLSSRFYSDAPILPIGAAVKQMKKRDIQDIIIYHPHTNDFAQKNLESFLRESFVWMHDWNEVMKTAGNNSTYFLSDITKIMKMKDAGVLEFSSIVIPQEYRYNKKDMNEFLYDYKTLMDEVPFKLAYTLACNYQ